MKSIILAGAWPIWLWLNRLELWPSSEHEDIWHTCLLEKLCTYISKCTIKYVAWTFCCQDFLADGDWLKNSFADLAAILHSVQTPWWKVNKEGMLSIQVSIMFFASLWCATKSWVLTCIFLQASSTSVISVPRWCHLSGLLSTWFAPCYCVDEILCIRVRFQRH